MPVTQDDIQTALHHYKGAMTNLRREGGNRPGNEKFVTFVLNAQETLIFLLVEKLADVTAVNETVEGVEVTGKVEPAITTKDEAIIRTLTNDEKETINKQTEKQPEAKPETRAAIELKVPKMVEDEKPETKPEVKPSPVGIQPPKPKRPRIGVGVQV
jgi:hypothetical protein